MLPAQDIQKMKQINISTDVEATKQRTKQALKEATRKQRNDIEALAGLKRVSIDRVSNTGSISAKIAVAAAQILNLNPFYLTGETEEHEEYSDAALGEFLQHKGYPELVKKATTPKRTKRQPASMMTLGNSGRIIPEMSEEDAVLLLRSLYTRVQYDGVLLNKLNQVQAYLV